MFIAGPTQASGERETVCEELDQLHCIRLLLGLAQRN